jgi:hypothetical protein
MDIQQFLFPSGGVSLNDIMTSAEAGVAVLLLLRTKEKDRQLENLNKRIEELEDDKKLLRAELQHCYEKRVELADKKLAG